MFQIKSYFEFLWRSKNQHGVHSPFVYHLVTNCFYDKSVKSEYRILKEFRNFLLQNNKIIEVVDFGAGSKIFKSNSRRISEIAKTAGITTRRAQLLLRISGYFKPSNILEIGTSLGLATAALASGNKSAKIITVEGCPQTASMAQQQFEAFRLNNIESVVSEFESYFSGLQRQTFDFVYFDGNHQKEATLNYFEVLLPTITNETVWIFDDIHWSEQMQEAWETIKKHPKVTVTIDTFQWGLIFFRKEQEKEHFVIRA
jgi:predicted O-methyltransferase YrrM